METKDLSDPPRSVAESVFGERVRQARESAGMSLAALSENLVETGVRLNTSQLSKIEFGRRATSVYEVVALSRVLGVTPGRLLDNENLHRWERRVIRYEAEGKMLSARRARLEADMAQLERDIEAHRQEAEAAAGKLVTPRVSSLT